MKDFVSKGTGNSRFLKSSISSTTTWEQFRDLLRGGTAPIDLNGINPLGVTETGTPLNKSTLLTDATAIKLGLNPVDNPTVNDALFATYDNLEFKVGDFKQSARTSIGENWALCNGDYYKKTDYQELFSAISNTKTETTNYAPLLKSSNDIYFFADDTHFIVKSDYSGIYYSSSIIDPDWKQVNIKFTAYTSLTIKSIKKLNGYYIILFCVNGSVLHYAYSNNLANNVWVDKNTGVTMYGSDYFDITFGLNNWIIMYFSTGTTSTRYQYYLSSNYIDSIGSPTKVTTTANTSYDYLIGTPQAIYFIKNGGTFCDLLYTTSIGASGTSIGTSMSGKYRFSVYKNSKLYFVFNDSSVQNNMGSIYCITPSTNVTTIATITTNPPYSTLVYYVLGYMDDVTNNKLYFACGNGSVWELNNGAIISTTKKVYASMTSISSGSNQIYIDPQDIYRVLPNTLSNVPSLLPTITDSNYNTFIKVSD